MIAGRAEQVAPDEAAFANYLASFALTDQETAEAVAHGFDDE